MKINLVGARVNYRIDERTMVYVDFGKAKFEEEDSLDAIADADMRTTSRRQKPTAT